MYATVAKNTQNEHYTQRLKQSAFYTYGKYGNLNWCALYTENYGISKIETQQLYFTENNYINTGKTLYHYKFMNINHNRT